MVLTFVASGDGERGPDNAHCDVYCSSYRGAFHNDGWFRFVGVTHASTFTTHSATWACTTYTCKVRGTPELANHSRVR